MATPGGGGRSLASRGSGGDGRRTNGESQSLFELDDAPLRIPPHAGGGGGGHRKAALSYVSAGSESEFSFDRVTVTTNETGNFSSSKMSSIDWGFVDGSGGSSSGGGGANNNNNNNDNNDDDGIVNSQQQQQQQQHAPSFVIAAGMDAAACAARGRTVVPPPVIERKSPITRLSPSSSSSPSSHAIQQNHKLSIHRLSPTIMGQDHPRRSYSPPPPRGRGHRLHLPHKYDIDSSSLPGSDVPVLTKSVNRSSNNVDDHSVISEISERTGAFFMDDDDDNNDNANDAVRALLYGEGGKIEEEMSPKSTATATTVRYKMNSGFGGGGGGDTSSPAASTKGQTIETPSYIHRQHQRLRTTKSNDCRKNDNTPFSLLSSSSPMTTIKALVVDIRTKYDTYMAARGSSGGGGSSSSQQQEEKQGQEQHQGCSIQSIIEDLQFCGWYLCCGMIDTTAISSPKQQQRQQKDATLEKTMLDAKEVRKKEAELTFLGKDIAVCGANTQFSSTTGIATNIGGGGNWCTTGIATNSGGRGNWCTQL